MAQFSRRRFLKGSLLAASAVGTPSILMNRAGGADANDTLSVAVLGANGRGRSHIGGFQNRSGCRVTCVCDPDTNVAQGRAEAVAKDGRKCKAVADLRRVFDDKSIDVVTIATPNHWHALAAIWAMQAGKDVYVEKPVSHNISEGRRMVETARRYNRICQTGTQCRSNPALRDAVQFLAEGGIGVVKFARGLCYKRRKSIGPRGDYPIPEAIDFNLWSGPATYTSPKLTRDRFHYNWHWQRHYGNGDLGNQGPHQTDIARWGLGIDRQPDRVIAYGGRLSYQAERKDDNYVDAGDVANTEVSIYDYGDKCIVFETRGLETPSLRGAKVGVIFHGSEGYLVQSSYTRCTAYTNDGEKIKEFGGGGDHFGNFVDAVRKRDKNVLNADVLEGHLSASISHLGNVSYYVGENNKVSVEEARNVLAGVKSLDDNGEALTRTVEHLKANGVDLDKYPISMGPLLKFDPQKEVFDGNDAANALLTREYRAGFVVPKAGEV